MPSVRGTRSDRTPLGGFTIGDADGHVVEHRPAQTGGLAMPISMSRRARLPAASQAGRRAGSGRSAAAPCSSTGAGMAKPVRAVARSPRPLQADLRREVLRRAGRVVLACGERRRRRGDEDGAPQDDPFGRAPHEQQTEPVGMMGAASAGMSLNQPIEDCGSPTSARASTAPCSIVLSRRLPTPAAAAGCRPRRSQRGSAGV